jgi:DUF971 family protein
MLPVPKSIRLGSEGGVAVHWSDGHSSLYAYAYLRKKCPCAQCREHPPQVISDDHPFHVVGRDPIRPQGADPVGHYAIQFHWNDGHSSGIYTYEYLREICPCDGCGGQSG